MNTRFWAELHEGGREGGNFVLTDCDVYETIVQVREELHGNSYFYTYGIWYILSPYCTLSVNICSLCKQNSKRFVLKY